MPSHVSIPCAERALAADLEIPDDPLGLVIFVHGSGSSRHSPRNRRGASMLGAAGFATLRADLFTPHEEAIDEQTRELRFDIPLLAARTECLIGWSRAESSTKALPIGLFGASTGAAAAVIAATHMPDDVGAIVSRGGRLDLAGAALGRLRAPLLSIVGGNDSALLDVQAEVLGMVPCYRRVEIIRGAGHLFEEPGALDAVARLTCRWFEQHITRHGQSPGTRVYEKL